MNQDKIQYGFLALVSILALVLVFFIFKPFIGVLFLALTLAIIFRPLYTLLLKITGGQESLAALLTTGIVFLVVLVPLTFFGFQIFRQSSEVYSSLNINAKLNPVDGLVKALEQKLGAANFPLPLDVDKYMRDGLSWLTENLNSFFSSLMELVLDFLLLLLTFYYLLKDGPRLRAKLASLSPAVDYYENQIFNRIETATNSVVVGVILIALIQGIADGVGFAVFGLPNVFLATSAAVIVSLIPVVSSILVIIPTAFYLWSSGDTTSAIGLAIWIGAIGMFVGNFLAPRIIGRRVKIHPLLTLLSVLGGIKLFGLIGFIMGPVVFAVFIELLDIYESLGKPK